MVVNITLVCIVLQLCGYKTCVITYSPRHVLYIVNALVHYVPYSTCRGLSLTTGQVPVVVSYTTGQYHNIALATRQYYIYCPRGNFDLRHRWATSHNDGYKFVL